MSRVRPAGRLTPAGRTPGVIAPTWPHGPGETSDITRARTELGWEPQIDLREGLARTIAWFRDHQPLADASWVSREPGPVTV